MKRDELAEIIRLNLVPFAEMGLKPTDKTVTQHIADYIIALSKHIKEDKVTFEK